MFLKFLRKKSRTTEKITSPGQEPIAGIDLEMNYCPECDDEYRADVAICASCQVVLVPGSKKLESCHLEQSMLADRSMDIQRDDDLVTVQRGGLIDLKALRQQLAEKRIPAIITGEQAGCRRGCSGPEMELQVRARDLEVAAELISDYIVRTTALNTHDLSGAAVVFNHLAKEVICPACQCHFSPTVGACPECGLCFE